MPDNAWKAKVFFHLPLDKFLYVGANHFGKSKTTEKAHFLHTVIIFLVVTSYSQIISTGRMRTVLQINCIQNGKKFD